MVVGVILDDEELLHIAIKGLPEEYNAFRSAIRTRSTTLSFDELATMLSAEEESLNDTFERKKKFAMAVNTTRPPPNSNYSQQNFGNKGRGRGNGNKGWGGGRNSRNSKGAQSQDQYSNQYLIMP